LNKAKNTVQAAQLPVNKLRPFEGHPFQVKDDAEMEQLVWSILTQGLLTPITVRPLPNDEYEVISGHRRLYACQKAGIETVPALIYALDRDAAAIALVDSNLHREKILPSEKAFAYKMKMDAIKRQGARTDLTSPNGSAKFRSDDLIGERDGVSGDTVRNYIANAPEFLAPKSMKTTFDAATGGRLLGIGDYFRCAYRSLAESYAKALAQLERNTGKQYDKLYIVGGGARNEFLNHLSAKATGKRVIALPMEATALGNLKIQMEADL